MKAQSHATGGETPCSTTYNTTAFRRFVFPDEFLDNLGSVERRIWALYQNAARNERFSKQDPGSFRHVGVSRRTHESKARKCVGLLHLCKLARCRCGVQPTAVENALAELL